MEIYLHDDDDDVRLGFLNGRFLFSLTKFISYAFSGW